MIPNSQTHYQTCFKVESTKDDDDTFFLLQRIVFGWLKTLEKDHLLTKSSKDFFLRCDWKNLWNTHASIGTNTCFNGDVTTWAMRYAHPDRELGPQRYWYTDIGLRKVGKVVTLFVRNSFARGQYDLASIHEAPATTTPRFIRYVFENPDLRVYSRSPRFPLRSVPGMISAGMGKALVDALLDRDRRYAVIVVNGDSDDLIRESEALAHDLAGKAQVFRLAKDPVLADEIRSFLPVELRIPFGSIRIFYPLNPKNPRPERHRWFFVSSDSYMEQRQGILNGLLRNHSLEEDLAVTNISEVGRFITLSKLRKLVDEKGADSGELQEFYSMYEDLEKERDDYKAEASQWAAEADAREQDLNELKAKMYAGAGVPDGGTNEGFDCKIGLKKLPMSLLDVVGLQAKIHAGSLAFAQEAFDSAGDYTNFSEIGKAWELLGQLGTTLHEIKFGPEQTGDIAKKFTDATGFEYAKTEGKQSKSDASIRNSRKIRFEGLDYEIWAHAKFGNEEPKMLRVHFDYDEKGKRIVIGYVGPHMTNATTRSKK